MSTTQKRNSSLEKALQFQQVVLQASTKIQASNDLFLREAVAAIRSLNLPSANAELDAAAHLWFGTPTWSRGHIASLAESCPPADASLHEREASVRSLDDVPRLAHPRAGGVAAPKPLPTRTALVAELHTAVLGGRHPELMNDDLAALLACTDGVALPAFSRTGLCGFGDMPAVRDPADVRPWLRGLLVDDAALAEHEPRVAARIQVVGGYRAGRNDVAWRGQPVAEYRCWYLFCRHRRPAGDGDGDDSRPAPGQDGFRAAEDGWAWRVVLCREGDVKEPEDARVTAFESIADFVVWLADWYARVDMQDVFKRYLFPGPECEF